jgi:hypothetical protein
MNCIPLPDELLHKVLRYINPIFEYQKYYKNLKDFEDTESELYGSTHDLQNIHHHNIAELIETTEEVASLSCLQLEYLREIEDFVKKNPKFTRPTDVPNFAKNQYKLQFDRRINKKNAKRLDEEIVIHRGMWHNPDERDEICVFDDINTLHSRGTIKDLIFACIMNNVRGWKTSFRDFVLKKYFINIAISPVKEIHYIHFVNHYYSDNTLAIENRVPTRATLIRKLLRL